MFELQLFYVGTSHQHSLAAILACLHFPTPGWLIDAWILEAREGFRSTFTYLPVKGLPRRVLLERRRSEEEEEEEEEEEGFHCKVKNLNSSLTHPLIPPQAAPAPSGSPVPRTARRPGRPAPRR